MTALIPSHGSRADFLIGTSGAPGTATSVTQYTDNVAFTFSSDKAEVSAFKNLFKAYVAGLKDLSVPLGGPADQNISTQMYNLFIMPNAGSAIIAEYAPEGIGNTGTALYTIFGFLDKYEEKTAINGAYVWTANYQSSTTPTRTIQ